MNIPFNANYGYDQQTNEDIENRGLYIELTEELAEEGGECE